MRKPRAVSLFAVAALLCTGLLQGSERPALPPEPVLSAQVSPAVYAALSDGTRPADRLVDLEFVTQSPADTPALTRAIQAAGGQVLLQEQTYTRARVPAAAALSLSGRARVAAVGADLPMTVDATPGALLPQSLDATRAADLAGLNFAAIGAPAFRAQHGVNGAGLTVAVIDTGIDPGHPALSKNPDGSVKLVDWKDFTGEGQMALTAPVRWGSSFTAPDGRTYKLPEGSAPAGGARFGYWEETMVRGKINRDLDRNGYQNDTFGVIVVDSTGSGRFDTVYVDTNNNNDFTDETPMKAFRVDHSVGRMARFREGPLAAQYTNFVVADVDPRGLSVTFGFDGHGHGTQVAGVLGAYNPNGFNGVAPGVRLMALKAISSADDASWFGVSTAIKYAAEHGADIINVSIQGLNMTSAYDATASEFLNNIARKYGVLIVLAAGNTGPGLSSGATLGNASEVLSVGSYYSPAMYKRDFGYIVPAEGVSEFSGMGPRADGAYLPNVIAPGGSPTTSPVWLDPTGYTAQVGTSIATPHVSGAAALLMQAATREGHRRDRMNVQRALEMGARFLDGYEIIEQGHGLVLLDAAYHQLQLMSARADVSARTREGGEGVLARSYRPGGADLFLVNHDTSQTRVNLVTLGEWIRSSLSSVTLPPGVARQVELQLNPPADPGVHSGFVIVQQADKYAPSITIPVTHVQPTELNGANQYRDVIGGQLPVTKFKRYFYSVTPGATELTVDAQMPPGPDGKPQGSMQLWAFRPDGQAAFISGTFGAKGVGQGATFRTQDPVPGVWEIVLRAVPDSEGTDKAAAFKLNTQVNPGFLSGPALRFNLGSGEQQKATVNVTNVLSGFTGSVEAVGLAKEPTSIPWKVLRGTGVVDDFTINSPIRAMRIDMADALPASVDLNLQVYRYDTTRNDFVLVSQPTDQNPKGKVVELQNLPAGRYQAVINPNGYLPEQIQYQYRRLVGLAGPELAVADSVRRHDPGQTWSVPLTLTGPATPGRYTGYLIVRDAEAGRSLNWIPVEVSAGQPALSVEPLVAQLRSGKPSWATFELRSGAGRALVDATVTVDGRRFYTHGGQVTVPVQASGSEYALTVEVDDPAYQITTKSVSLPVQERWGLHPIGSGGSEEFVLWRRKVISQLP